MEVHVIGEGDSIFPANIIWLGNRRLIRCFRSGHRIHARTNPGAINFSPEPAQMWPFRENAEFPDCKHWQAKSGRNRQGVDEKTARV